MAKGLRQHQEHLAAVNLLGKDLARRAGRACELCEEREGCRPYELEPGAEPTLDGLVLLCPPCRELADRPGSRPSGELRHLEQIVWSTVRPVRSVAVRLLEAVGEPWADDAIANAALMAESDETD